MPSSFNNVVRFGGVGSGGFGGVGFRGLCKSDAIGVYLGFRVQGLRV